jgi:hypothetical protein
VNDSPIVLGASPESSSASAPPSPSIASRSSAASARAIASVAPGHQSDAALYIAR